MRREEQVIAGPRWRVILEAHWRDQLQEVTELSLAYHGAVGDAPDSAGKRAQQLVRRTVAARQRLADTEDALDRLAAGHFGECEQCGALIPADLLFAAPESRYCPDCAVAALSTDARERVH